MIYISTGGHRLKNAAETALDFYSHGIVGVELSGGTFSATYQADLLALPPGVNASSSQLFSTTRKIRLC